MNLYLNYFAKEENSEGDTPPIGIVLSARKNEIDVEYALGGISNKLFVSKYRLYLPDKKEGGLTGWIKRDMKKKEVFFIVMGEVFHRRQSPATGAGGGDQEVGMGHQPHHVAALVADPGDASLRTVGVFGMVAEDDLPLPEEGAQMPRVPRHEPAFAVRDGQLERPRQAGEPFRA